MKNGKDHIDVVSIDERKWKWTSNGNGNGNRD